MSLTPAPHFPALSLPDEARRALTILEDAGYEAWLVGGFVRDAVLGRTPGDIDIATNAHWREVQHAFETAGYSTHETGVKHGTITVVVNKRALEITTYRADGVYRDARHPDEVHFVRTIEEDLARRDFTINALAYHPARGFVDPYDGAADIQTGILRTVGDAHKRFTEDALRILRGCRFAAQLGFSFEAQTYRAMLERKHLLSRISTERVTHELTALLLGAHIHDALMATVDVLSFVLPELTACKGFEQRTPYHIHDVLEHIAWVVQHTPAEPLQRWAALCHDLGKPAAFFCDEAGTGHFYGHPHISVELARGILKRFSFSSAFIADVLTLVKYHDDVIEPTPKSVKRALTRLGGDERLFAALCDLKRADALSQAPQCAYRVETADELERVLTRLKEEGAAFSVRDLAINGNDVLALGVPQGRAVGGVLRAALAAVIDEEVENTRDALLEFARIATQRN